MNGITNIETDDALSNGSEVLRLLSESEKSYRQLADAMPQIVWTARPNGFLDYYNQRWFDYTGMTLEQTEGWGWEPVLHPDDLQNCINVWSEAVRTGEKYKVEYRFKQASNGEYRWHLGQALPIRDAESRVVKWFGTCTDIHEQKKIEEELRQIQEELELRVKERTIDLKHANSSLTQQITERRHTGELMRQSEEKYRNILGSIEEGYFEIDLKGNFTFFNGALCSILGYDKDEAEGMNYRQYVDSANGKKLLIKLARIFKTGQPISQLDWEVTRRDSTRRGVESSISLILDDAQEPIGFRGIVRDVTQSKRAEKELLESETRYRRLFESNPNPTWVWDVETLEFLAVNEEATRLFGYSREEFQKLTTKDLRPQEDLSVFLEYVAQANAGIEKFHSMRLQKKDGTIIEVEITLQTINFDGKRARLTLITDVTERKRAEKELQESQQLLKTVIDALPQAIWWKDRESVYLGANRIIANAAGLDSPEKMIGLTDYDMPWEKEEADFFRECDRRVMESGVPELNIVEPQLQADGKQAWLNTNKVPLRNADGEIVGVIGTFADITERKHAEEALALESSLLKALMDNIPDAIYFKDTQSRFVRVSKHVHLKGMKSPEEAIGKTDFDFFDEEIARPYYEDEQRIVRTGEPLINKVQKEIFPDGTSCWVSATKVPIFNAEGKVTGIVGISRDITEVKRGEEAIENSRDYLNRIINAVADPIFVNDRQHRMVLVNDAFCQLTGGTREEIIGKSPTDLCQPEEARIFMQMDNLVFESRKETSNEEQLTDKDGNRHVIMTKKTVYEDQKGKQFIVGVIRDITANKNVEEVLKASETIQRQLAEQQSAILDSLPAHICLLDQSGRILEVNNEWKQFALGNGYSGIDFGVGSNYIKTCENATGDCAEGAKQAADICRAVLSGECCNFEMEYPCHSPTEKRWFKLTVTPLHKEKLAGAVVMHVNITERKRIEEELEQTRDAALESVRLKSEFLANMSHEIRTPMNGVLGMTGLLLDTNLSEEQHDYAQTVQSSADALLRIIDDILDFSKIEAGQLHFEKIDFDLRECIELPIELLAERAHSKGIELASLVYHDVPTLLCGDPGRLRQILTNLVGNAIKFTEKGEVTVKVRKQSDQGKYVSLRFEVTDTGIGISEQAQRGLFQAFVQADGSTTRKYGGTGLGLAISKQLVELMGGEIGIESARGAGSTFWFTARFEKQTKQISAIQSVQDVSLEGVRLLIVDDNATNRKIFLHQTASWGMIAEEAESGEEALKMLRAAAVSREPFEIAILDLMMPEMDGFELARSIKSEPALSGTHLVLLPSYGKKGDGQTAREFGIAAYLQKPVRQSLLYNCLMTVIMEASGNSGSDQTPHLITQHSLRSTTIPNNVSQVAASKARILVAEDNAVNQKVALKQLKSLGYAADVVQNGREAVEAIEKHGYDVVLMDCQMPEMDGFEATAEIRARESDSNHTVIIAMTAHALEGEYEKCLAAGMDDYISKPVKIETLGQTLKKWLTQTAETIDAGHPDGAALDRNDDESVDRAVLADFRDLQQPGEPDVVTELIDLFLEDAEKRVTILKQAAARSDFKTIIEQAHAIKGASGNIGALKIMMLSNRLEEKTIDISRAQLIIPEMEDELENVARILKNMRQSDS